MADELNIYILEPLSVLDLAKKRKNRKIEKIEITDISCAVEIKAYARYF